MSFSPIQTGTTTAPTWTSGTAPTGSGEVQGKLGGHTVTALATPPHAALGEALRATPQPTSGRPLQERTVSTAPQAPAALRREALATPTALRDTVGEPKRDWKLFGITVMHRSTGHKDVLNKLESFHKAAGNDRPPAPPTTPESRKAYAEGQIHKLSQELGELERSCDAYAQGNSRRSHRDDIAQLKGQVQAQRAQLDGLRDQIGREGMPEGLSVADARAFSQHKPPLSLQDIHAVTTALRAIGMNPAELQAGVERLFSLPLDGESLVQAIKLKMPEGLAQQYAQTGVPIRPETAGLAFNDKTLDRSPEAGGGLTKLGSGAVNTVFKGHYQLGDGTRFTGVFKPSVPGGEQPDAVSASGINTDRPVMEQRNVAVHRLDQHLGMGVTPKAEIGVHEVDGQQRMGLVMSFAPGLSPLKSGDVVVTLSPEKRAELSASPELATAYAREKGFVGGKLVEGGLQLINSMEVENMDGEITVQEKDAFVAFDFSDPVLREKTTDLQWLDALCGQVDRHGHNYIVQQGADGRVTGVIGIDNDIAFGDQLTDPNDVNPAAMRTRTGESPPFKGCVLPQVVSTKTATALLAMTPDKMLELMGPGFTPGEQAAAQSRLGAIQTHVRDLQAKGQVAERTEDWGSERVGSLLGMGTTDALTQLETLRSQQPRTPAVNRQIQALEEQISNVSYVARESSILAEVRTSRQQPLLDPRSVR
ncbi:hypothetical protein [Acidovorax sp. LjRoot117]|uniref:hypothetical protein n=1 Tax=Acidovorax sp. LjRoot117 TaxID=3342255 RepID=UPI003ECF4879